MKKADKIPVLLVEDHALVRKGIRRLLEDENDIAVVGEAGDGAEAVRMARELSPKVVVMDCAMPVVDGLSATVSILQQQPEINVVMLSMHSEETWVRRALASGARGYVLKSALDLDLADTVRRVAAGEQVLDPRIDRSTPRLGEGARGLTPRELQVLQQIAEGKSNKEIATALRVSVNTVAVHRANIMDALNIHKTAELVVYAIRHGLVNVS